MVMEVKLLQYIIRKTMWMGFSKRWVSFHKTTRIFFEGFSHPSFFSLWTLSSELAPRSEFALSLSWLWVLSSLWALSWLRGLSSLWVLIWLRGLSRGFCSFRFCFSLVLAAFLLVFSTFLWLDSTFFLILFGGFDFVRTFAVHIWCVGTGSLAVYRHEVGYHWPHFFISFRTCSSLK